MIVRFIVFFGTFLTVFGGSHWLVGSRLVALLGLTGTARSAVWFGLLALGLSSVAGQFLSHSGAKDSPWSDALYWVGFTWMGFLMLLFFAAVAGDLVWLVGRIPGIPEAIVHFVRAGLLGLAVVGGIVGIRTALSDPSIHEVVVKIPDLPQAFDGYRIAQITDTHIGPTLRRAWVERLVQRVDSANADLVVHTGDFVDGPVSRMAVHVEPFNKLYGRDGVLFVTGNHESYSGLKAWSDHAVSLGFNVLLNSHVVITRGSEHLVVAGVTDLHEGQFLPDRRPDATKAFAGSPVGTRILLAHQPVQAKAAQGLHIALQLSGHTHGGQIWPFHYLVKLAQPVVSGFGRVGDVLVFVSNGAGYWGPPMRLFAPPEVPILVLKRG